MHTASQLAEETQLPLPTVSKVLKVLARAGLLTSHRGVQGGYKLAKSPEKITVGEVIRALEGPISLVQCGTEPGLCEQEQHCPTRVSWARISLEIERALEQVPISEMVSTCCAPMTMVGIENPDSTRSAS